MGRREVGHLFEKTSRRNANALEAHVLWVRTEMVLKRTS